MTEPTFGAENFFRLTTGESVLFTDNTGVLWIVDAHGNARKVKFEDDAPADHR